MENLRQFKGVKGGILSCFVIVVCLLNSIFVFAQTDKSPITVYCRDYVTGAHVLITQSGISDFIDIDASPSMVSGIISHENCYTGYGIVLGTSDEGGSFSFSLVNSLKEDMCRVMFYAQQLYEDGEPIEASLSVNGSEPVSIATKESSYGYFACPVDLSVADLDDITVRSTARVMLRGLIFVYAGSSASAGDVESVNFSSTKLTMTTGQSTDKLWYTVEPKWSINQNVIWSSSDEEIVSVTQQGVITAMSPGTASIFITSESNPDISSECKVEVKEVVPEKITVLPAKASLGVGGKIQYYVETEPANASKRVLWTTRYPSKINLSDDGICEGLTSGAAIVTATSALNANVSGFTSVTVKDFLGIESVVLSENELTMYVDDSAVLSATVLPEGASNKKLSWSSSSPSVVTVSEDGTLTAHSVGNAIINAYSNDESGISASCTVTVMPSETASVEAPSMDSLTVGIVDDSILISGYNEGETMTLSDISGRQILSRRLTGSETSIKINVSPTVYILKIGGKSCKISIP